VLQLTRVNLLDSGARRMCRHQAGELHLVTVAAAVYELKIFEGAVEE